MSYPGGQKNLSNYYRFTCSSCGNWCYSSSAHYNGISYVCASKSGFSGGNTYEANVYLGASYKDVNDFPGDIIIKGFYGDIICAKCNNGWNVCGHIISGTEHTLCEHGKCGEHEV